MGSRFAFALLFFISLSVAEGQAPVQAHTTGHAPAQAPTQTCQTVEELEPPFRVIQPGASALDRSFKGAGAASVQGYYPQGTIVKLVDEDFGKVPLVGTIFPKTLFPRVKVISVPPTATLVEGSTAAVKQGESANGQRASVGTIGFIRATDITPLVGSVTSPANTIFQVRRDTPLMVSPELRGRPVRLAHEGAFYLTQRCCPAGPNANVGLFDGNSHKRETERNPNCKYSPIFELLKPVDRGAGTALSYQVEKRFAPGSCDVFSSALSPIGGQNQRAAFMLGQVLSQPNNEDLARLQKAASEQALRSRKLSRSVGSGSRAGNQSKGMCKQAVNDILMASGFISERIPGEHAYMAKPYLGTVGFENVMDRVQTSKEAPPGSVLVYEKVGGGSGHIEIKVDSETYCSDFCKDSPIDAYVGARRLIGIYVKKKPAL